MDTYAGGADKIGHMWGNYSIVRGISGILEWGGWSKKMALTTATGMTLGFFVVAEIKDGYKPQYGFSWGDIIFNVSGEALGLLFETQPKLDEMLDFKIEYFPSKAFRDSIGTDGPFNSSEDYTGQRFFVSYHLSTIDALRQSRYFGWSEYLDVSVGYQAAHFRPEYADPNDHKQDLFVGLQLNVQRIVDNALMPSARSGKKPGGGTRALHFCTEIFQVPFTTLRVGGLERTGPDLDPPTSTITSTAPVRSE
jgi:hypothetical protein